MKIHDNFRELKEILGTEWDTVLETPGLIHGFIDSFIDFKKIERYKI